MSTIQEDFKEAGLLLDTAESDYEYSKTTDGADRAEILDNAKSEAEDAIEMLEDTVERIKREIEDLE